jgi:hypothetical protein
MTRVSKLDGFPPFLAKIAAKVVGRRELASYGHDGDRPQTDAPQTAVEELFWEHQGPIVNKWHHYLPVYDRYFAPWRGRPVRMLEIGVSLGGSLDLWRRFFGPEAVIYGIDINPDCAKFDGRSGQVRIGSQADPAFLKSVVAEMGGIDIVLDDGSHQSAHMRASLEVLYPLLAKGGLYAVEDLHACYWRSFGGGYRKSQSFIEDVKGMVDDIHHWYHDHGERNKATAGYLRGIHLYDSMVILEKAAIIPPRHSQRGSA